MTREMIIEQLERHRQEFALDHGWNTSVLESLDAAIKVLKQEPCEDAISRQAVLDTIDSYIFHHMGLLDLKLFVTELASVQPEPKTGHWIAYEVRLPDRTILNYRCSVCGRKLIGYNTETLSEAPFCHCGAKMLPTGSESEGV